MTIVVDIQIAEIRRKIPTFKRTNAKCKSCEHINIDVIKNEKHYWCDMYETHVVRTMVERTICDNWLISETFNRPSIKFKNRTIEESEEKNNEKKIT